MIRETQASHKPSKQISVAEMTTRRRNIYSNISKQVEGFTFYKKVAIIQINRNEEKDVDEERETLKQTLKSLKKKCLR